MKVLGKFTAITQANGIKLANPFIVLADNDVQSENLLGYASCKLFKLIAVADVVRFNLSGTATSEKGRKNKHQRTRSAMKHIAEKQLSKQQSVEHTYAKVHAEATSHSKFSKMAPEPEKTDSVKQRIMRDYSTLFENRIGKMPNTKVHFDTDPSVVPKQRRHFPVPYCLVPSTQKKLT